MSNQNLPYLIEQIDILLKQNLFIDSLDFIELNLKRMLPVLNINISLSGTDFLWNQVK